jgi:hypothetical protein
LNLQPFSFARPASGAAGESASIHLSIAAKIRAFLAKALPGRGKLERARDIL